MWMRGFVAAACLVAAFATGAPAAAQENWPQRQVNVIVPFSAGGSTDLIARILTQHLQAKLNAPFVVENKGGAGGSIGTGLVAKAANDGYTLLVGTVSSSVINAFLYTRLPFDLEKDLEPVALLATLPNLLIVNPKLPAKTVPELVAYLKANPGKATFGSSGIGTSSHLSSVMFQGATGTSMTHVPFRSTNEVINSLIGGHIDLAIDSMTTAWPQAKEGTVRPLAVTTPKRSETAPDLPTIGETLQGFQATAWQGLFAPAGTPRPILDKLSAEVKRILEMPEVVAQLKGLGAEPSPSTPSEFAEFLKSERIRWQEVVKASGAKID
jgi:tripartite-type tricarboxylate transporter receptor subunit TctC